MTKTNRIGWMDAARGIGITLVVFGHVERGLISSGLAPMSWLGVDFTLYTFHMPLFFLLAGFNAPRGLERGSKTYLSEKIGTIIYPYFLWSLIQGTILVELSSLVNEKAYISEIFSILWLPMSQFWFLYVLMMIHITVSIIGYRPIFYIFLSFFSFCLSQFLTLNTVPERYCHSLPFFLLGAVLAARAHAIGPSKLSLTPIILWLLFAAAVDAAWHVSALDYDKFWCLPATILGMSALIATARILTGRLQRTFAYLGIASMTIYVMHILAEAGLRILMIKLKVPASTCLYLITCTLAGIIAPLLAHAALSRLGLLPLFGLAAWKRRPVTLPYAKTDKTH